MSVNGDRLNIYTSWVSASVLLPFAPIIGISILTLVRLLPSIILANWGIWSISIPRSSSRRSTTTPIIVSSFVIITTYVNKNNNLKSLLVFHIFKRVFTVLIIVVTPTIIWEIVVTITTTVSSSKSVAITEIRMDFVKIGIDIETIINKITHPRLLSFL